MYDLMSDSSCKCETGGNAKVSKKCNLLCPMNKYRRKQTHLQTKIE